MPLESKLQSRIIKDLKKNGWLVVKIIRCSVSGFPDCFLLKNKRVIFIEVKAPGKEAEPLQKYVQAQLKVHGFEVHTINSYEAYQNLKL